MTQPALPRWWRLLVLVLAAAAASGCGWSQRDEFLHSRSIVLHSQPGDGSLLAFQDRPGAIREARVRQTTAAQAD